ncbi:MAG: VWA domain-containing protein [Gemmatimonadota bacterium]
MGLGAQVWLAAASAASVALLLRGLGSYRTRMDREALGDDVLLDRLAHAPPAMQRMLRAVLLAAGCGALAAGLTVGGASEDVPEESDLQTVLVLDASNSMWARDVEPSRLERQRVMAADLALRLPGRLGIVYFAGRGYVLSPLTEDRDAVLMFVQTLDPALVGQGGTSLAEGLRQGLDVLAGGDEIGRRILVVMTDGEATAETEAVTAEIERAVRMRIPVFTVGLGTPEGARIPVPDRIEEETLESAPRARERTVELDGERWLMDERGEPVVSQLDEAALAEMSLATGGMSVRADDEGLEDLLDRLEEEGGRPDPGTGRKASMLLLAAFGLLFAEGYLGRRG